LQTKSHHQKQENFIVKRFLFSDDFEKHNDCCQIDTQAGNDHKRIQ
jgi:hypothetical protein